MAKVFLDANYFIDIVYRDQKKGASLATGNHQLHISLLSIHIYCYTAKIKIPNVDFESQLEKFSFVELKEKIIISSIAGPTTDMEDNIQLHSAAEAECDYFLTSDKKLLAMTYFGKAKIVNTLAK